MKKILLLILWLGLLSQTGFSQYYPIYGQMRGIYDLPQYDTIRHYFNTDNYERAVEMLDSLGSDYADSGQYRQFHKTQNEMATMLFHKQKYKQSKQALQKVMTVMQEQQDTLTHEYAMSLRFLGYISQHSNVIKTDKIVFSHRQKRLLNSMNDSSRMMVDCYGDLGLAYIMKEELDKGLPYIMNGMKLGRKIDAGLAVFVLEHTITNQLANNQPELSLEIFKKQLEQKYNKARSYIDSVHMVHLAATIAQKYYALNHYKKSIHYFKLAQEIFDAIDHYSAHMGVNIPLNTTKAYSRSGNKSKMLIYRQKTMEAHRKYKDQLPPPLVSVYTELAEAYLNVLPDSAIVYLDKAVHSISKTDKRYSYTKWLSNIYMLYADYYKQTDSTQKAKNYLVKAINTQHGKGDTTRHLRFFCEAQNKDMLKDAYLSAVELLTDKNQPGTYQSAINAALCADTLLRQISTSTTGEREALALSEEYSKMTGNVLRLIENKPEYNEMAFYFIGMSKSFQLSNEINKLEIASAAAKNNSLWNQKMAIEQKIKKLKAKKVSYNIKKKPTLSDSIDNEIKKLQIDLIYVNYQILKKADKQKQERYSSGFLASVRSNLRPEQALLDYFHYKNQTFLIFISQEQLIMKSLSSPQKINKLIRSCYRALKTGGNTETPASKLSSILLSPIKEQLANFDELIIIPDGNLNQLPFDILPGPATKEMLVQNYAISYNYSTKLWLKATSASIANDYSLLAVAPVFDSNKKIEPGSIYRSIKEIEQLEKIIEEKSLAPLPYSLREVNKIGDMLGQQEKNVKLLTYDEANETNLKNNFSKYDIVHLATHGFSAKKSPEYSGLFFAADHQQNGEEKNDGYLHLGEIYNLPHGANLVVLSACKSGAGRIIEGEGVYALPRGFILAGIPNVISSLWKIHDQKTEQLMIQFYKNLLAGDNYAKALQKAKKYCINQGYLPVDWSGIVLTGK